MTKKGFELFIARLKAFFNFAFFGKASLFNKARKPVVAVSNPLMENISISVG